MIRSIVVLAGFVLLGASSAAADPTTADPAALRKTCTEAMNADPGFAKDVVKDALALQARDLLSLCTDADTIKTHEQAAERVATNERHVILAYGAMWVIAAAFVIFLWRRQQALRAEIAQLRKELDAATKEPAK
jgi:hypothetical protein